MTEQQQGITLSENLVATKIYLIRDKRVMLDKDLAELYEVETRALNQAVSRNIERFPEAFMFQLNPQEFEITICDIKLGRYPKTSVRIYRTRRCNAFQCFKEQKGHTGKHPNHVGIYKSP